MNETNTLNVRLLNSVVIVAALGYFVDIYDLILFGIVKNPSLTALGVTGKEALFSTGNYLLRMQMIGMLIGGVVWGILGDKRGRMSTLFLTILLYSLANIANGFVTTVEQYAWLRLLAGFGLAGELGVGITLVSEVLGSKKRGLGAGLVSGIGIFGAAFAFTVVKLFDWRVAFFTGGGLGLLLLFLRLIVHESGMYAHAKQTKVAHGKFLALFTNKKRLIKYLTIIGVGIPAWYTVSVLAINAQSFAADALACTEPVSGATSVMWHYIGAALGSFLFGYISNKLQSRRKAIITAIGMMIAFSIAYFAAYGVSSTVFYAIIFLLGIPMGGLWAVFIATASELFGTNIRATVTTSAPNFVRGATVLITLGLDSLTPSIGLWLAGIVIGIICLGLAFILSFFVEETYGKDLDYIEEVH